MNYTSGEYVLTINKRSGKDFEGAVRVGAGKESSTVEVAGTIDEKGVANYRVTRRGKGKARDDIVDNWRCQGTFKGDEFTGKFIVPGDNVRGGEISLRMSKPDAKKP